MAHTGVEDKFVQSLLDEGPDGYVLIESKMVRGSTHDKDRTTATRLVDSENLSDELEALRETQQADMAERRAFDPDEDPDGGA